MNELVHADLQVNGQTRKVIMQAHRNGFFYVLERATGKVVAANKFVKVNWADGVDLETGRPVWSAETKSVFEKGAGHKVRSLAGAGRRQELGADVVQPADPARLRELAPTSAGTTSRSRWRSWPSSSPARRPISA